MTIPVFVLSLRDATARRQAVQRALGDLGLPFQFVDAVDGRRMTGDGLSSHYDHRRNATDFKRPLSGGEVACALSHRTIWEKVATGKSPVVLVCEDDLSLLADPGAFLDAARAAGPALEDVMIKLDGPARGGEAVGQLGGIDLMLCTRLPARTTGYLIGRRAARKLLAAAGPVARPIDMDLKHYWEHGVPILVAHPQMIAESDDLSSSLDNQRKCQKSGSALTRLRENLNYQLRMEVKRLRNPLRVGRLPALSPLRDFCKSHS